jgi:hypothetical protein
LLSGVQFKLGDIELDIREAIKGTPKKEAESRFAEAIRHITEDINSILGGCHSLSANCHRRRMFSLRRLPPPPNPLNPPRPPRFSVAPGPRIRNGLFARTSDLQIIATL